MNLLLQLLIAHLLGDFIFQPNKWVTEKEKRKLRSPKLYLHILLHILLTFICIWEIKLWYVPLTIGISHFIIDASKLLIQTKKTKRLLFFIDQVLHIAVIFLIWMYVKEVAFTFKIDESHWLLITCVLFLTFPTSILIKTIISIYTPKTNLKKDESLQNAGKYIGILERLLVFIFIVTNHWEGVGFLVAAKSIFRFSDLTQAKDRKLTEYILIGTLISFGSAILIGILYQYVIFIT